MTPKQLDTGSLICIASIPLSSPPFPNALERVGPWTVSSNSWKGSEERGCKPRKTNCLEIELQWHTVTSILLVYQWFAKTNPTVPFPWTSPFAPASSGRTWTRLYSTRCSAGQQTTSVFSGLKTTNHVRIVLNTIPTLLVHLHEHFRLSTVPNLTTHVTGWEQFGRKVPWLLRTQRRYVAYRKLNRSRL